MRTTVLGYLKNSLHSVAPALLLGTLVSVPAGAQITMANFTTWDLPSSAGTNPVGLVVDKFGATGTASPAGTVWYVTQNTLIRFVPGSPVTSAPASWTRWNLGDTTETGGLKIAPNDVVFVRTRQALQRFDPNLNARTVWADGSSRSDVALDANNNVWSTIDGTTLQRLAPIGQHDATVTRWDVGGGVGVMTLSGVAVNPGSGLVYYAEPFGNSIGELNPATGINNVRRWNLTSLGGYEPRQLSIESGGVVSVTTGMDQIIRLNPATNEAMVCHPPTPASNPVGVVASNGLIGFTEGANKIGCLISGATPIPVTPSITTIAAVTATLRGTTFIEAPVSGVVAPVNSSELATHLTTACGTFIEGNLPSGCCYPTGIDADPAGPLGSFYYALNWGGQNSNRIGRVVLPLPK